MIFETNDKFPFDKLVVGKPTNVPGGNFFIRYSIDDSPLYIQPPKCTIKQIHSKTGKKMYCDVIFQQENEQFIRWMESLESKSQQMIYSRRDEWFETPLDLEEIEGSFVSPMKIFKAGKSYVVRTCVPVKGSNLKIYDEDEKDVQIDTIKENTQVMVILEIQGIRCSASSFQIEIELKQMMVMKPEDLFNQFIFKKKSVPLGKEENNSKEENIMSNNLEHEEAEQPEEAEEDNESKKINISTELCEVDFDLDDMSKNDVVNIKDRKEMYYEMYREARQKAKIARDLALSAYLEAKRIKNTYMLDDIISSSSDEDSDEEEDDTND